MKYQNIILPLLIVVFAFSLKHIKAQYSPRIDSLIEQIKTMPNDTNKVISLNKVSFALISRDFKKSIESAEQGLQLSKQLKYKYGTAISLMSKGTAHLYTGDFNTANTYYDSSRILMQNTNNHHFKAQINNNLGLANLKLEKLETALKYFYKAYQLKKDFLNSESIERTLGNISNCYYHQEKYDKALEINFELIEMYLVTNNQVGLSNLYVNFAQIYLAENDMDKSLLYLDKAKIIAEKINNDRYIAIYLSTLSEVYTKQERHEESIEVNMRIIEIAVRLKAKEPLAYSYLYLAKNYFQLKQYKEAINYCEKSIEISKEIKLKKILLEAYKLLSDINNNMGNFKEAYNNSATYLSLYDSVFNEKKQKQIEEIQAKYETERAEQDIINLTKEKELQSVQNQNKTYLIIVLVLIILISSITVQYFFRSQKNKHLNKINEERTAEAESQKRRFAKELHDNTGSNLSGIRLQLLALEDNLNTQKIKEIIGEVENTHQGIRLLSYQASAPEFKNFTLEESIDDLVNRLSRTGAIKIHYHSTVSINWSKIDHSYQLNIYRIIQEAISNTIKHSEAKNVDIQITQHLKNLNIIIEDDGKGFEITKTQKGLGLKNIIERTEELNGDINLDSSPGNGCSIIIDLPLPKNIHHA